ncbi:MAG: DUF86 domain-containing protein [Chloroflexi bacterium]|nr:DUF86 domain-containing protein [Chloroflexota bacterium]
MKDDRLYLIYIDECISRIEEYISGGRAAFFEDIKTQDAVLRNLQTLAESTQRLSAELKARYPGADWQGMSGFRNVVVHNYLGVNLNHVWEIVSDDIPKLKETIKLMIEERGD